jgi:hypothetical protein
MDRHVDFVLLANDLATFKWYHLVHSPEYRRTMRVFGVWGPLLMLVLALLSLLWHDDPGAQWKEYLYLWLAPMLCLILILVLAHDYAFVMIVGFLSKETIDRSCVVTASRFRQRA